MEGERWPLYVVLLRVCWQGQVADAIAVMAAVQEQLGRLPPGEMLDAADLRPKLRNRPAGAEAILQVRAALLSADDWLEQNFADRPGNPYRRRAAESGDSIA